MASSDDEGETVPMNVSDYEFVYGDNDSVSFAELPLKWNKDETLDGKLQQQIFVKGKTDNGLRSLYTEVKAWKFDLSCKRPDISVLTVDSHWIKLLRPRKAFEVIIRTILITVHYLHFIKWNSEISHKTMWDHLAKRFRFETRPSEDDLVDHMSLIQEAVKRDETLAKSKILTTFLNKKPSKRRVINEDINPSFIVDDVSETEDEEQKSEDASEIETEEADVDDCFDSVCAICDNGGHIYLCEGKCMRSFHATEEDGEDSLCYSLGFTEEEVEAIKNVDFYCKNCEYKQHQCFSCGELGSSDESSGAEVFRCINGACGRFYHPNCVAKLLHPKDKAAAEEHCQKIGAGEQFACPVHKCHVCNELEVKSNHDLQFAICRRCPRAYHRKCLPRGIASEKDVEEGRAEIQRAWEDLIPKRILIYCLNHDIDDEFLTPVRNHIKFPGPAKKKRKLLIESSQMDLSKDNTTSGKRSNAKPLKVVHKVMSSGPKKGDISRTRVDKLPAKQKVSVNRNSNESRTVEDRISLGNRLYAAYGLDSEPTKASRVRGEHEKTQNRMPTTKRINNTLTLDDDARKRILSLMKDASSSVTLEDIKKRHKAPSTHAHSLKLAVENVTLGKVEGSVQALRTALEKLDKGGSVQDAKAVCGNDLLVQVMKWKERLKVYLSPFLYGMRYTSFGRHFTKIDKLQEIVDMFHYYIQDGDMMVDFCCGSNDFSWLMKQKVDEVGKTCLFKNYDIIQSKNDFCFETRDWMKVKPHELPKGSQLIMGLNPPFGVNAALANKFIDHALEFNPKLLILIVPRETQRLDEKKKYPYDLIWEDDQMLAGKSFYLPGSVDVNDKQIEDWNVNAPLLYLWSHPDWTRKHKAIAQQHGHPGSRNIKCKSEEEKESHLTMPLPNQSQNNNKPQIQNQVEDKKPPMKKEEENPQVKEKSSMEIPRQHQEEGSRDTERDNNNNNRFQSNNHSEPNMKGSSGGKGKKKRKRGLDKKAVQGKSPTRRPAPIPSPNLSSPGSYPSKPVHSQRHRSISIERPPRIQKRSDNYHQAGSDENQVKRSDNYHQAGSDENQVRYSLMGEVTFPSMASTYNNAHHSPNPDYGFRASAERMGPANFPPYNNRSYDQNYGSELSYQSQASIHGGPIPWGQSQRPDYLLSRGQMNQGPFNATINYGGMSSSTSAMQRYAPCLDDSNHGRMGPFPGQPASDPFGHPGGPRPGGSQGGSLGFAPGPYRPPYSHHGSSGGWLDE